MEILGVGTPELIVILIIMLIVAGPKRMIQWAYLLGQYTAKLRKMWAEAMVYMEKEFQAAGMEVELPKEVPTRATLMKEITRIGEQTISPVTKPIQDTLKDASAQVKELKAQTSITQGNGSKQPSQSASTPPGDDNPDYGTWSNKPKSDE